MTDYHKMMDTQMNEQGENNLSHLTKELHVRVNPQPQDRGISVHGRQVHVHLLACHQGNLLLLVAPTLGVAGDLKLGLVLLNLEGVVEGAIQLLDGYCQWAHVAQPPTRRQVLFDLQLHHVALAVEDKVAKKPDKRRRKKTCKW